MGKAKNNEAKSYTLTDQEYNHLKILNVSLEYHTLKNEIISGFLYSVAHGRLNFESSSDLQFELDFEANNKELKIRELPKEA